MQYSPASVALRVDSHRVEADSMNGKRTPLEPNGNKSAA